MVLTNHAEFAPRRWGIPPHCEGNVLPATRLGSSQCTLSWDRTNGYGYTGISRMGCLVLISFVTAGVIKTR